MKKKITLSISVVIFTMAMAMTFNQKAHSKVTPNLLLENIEVLTKGETGPGTGKWFVTFNPIGHDCWGRGSWCCPGLDC